jgi:hypothetical protein
MNSIKRMKLTGAAILVSRGMKVLQAAPAAYPYRSTARVPRESRHPGQQKGKRLWTKLNYAFRF